MSWILVCAAEFNAQAFDALYNPQEDTLVAVDAGLRPIQAAGCVPDILLGDFDSLGETPVAPEGVEVLGFPPEKDYSDLHLALDIVRERGARTVHLFGALGGRLDHTLVVLQTCAAFAGEFEELVLHGMAEEIHILGSGQAVELEPVEDAFVSVLSLVDESAGVKISGMKYAFEGMLTNKGSLGLSNEFAERTARVSLEFGALAVIVQLV